MNRTKLLGEMPRQVTKLFQVRTKAVQPTEEQYERIKPFLLREFAPEELYIRQMELANDQYDRSNERFDIGYLRRFNETIVGRSVLIGHEYGTAPVGRFFQSSVGEGANGWQWVIPWFYMPKSDGNALFRDNIDSGVWSYVSIGAYVDYAGLICDICGGRYYPWYADESEAQCPHISGEAYDGTPCRTTWTTEKSDMSQVEAVEGSIVYLGCQYDAAVAKSAETDQASIERKLVYISRNPITGTEPNGGDSMLTEEQIKALQDENNRLKTSEQTAAKLAEDRKTELEALKPKAEAGETYVTDLREEIVRIGTLLGEEKAAQFVSENVHDVSKLKELKAEYETRWAAKQPPKPQSELPENGTTETRAADERAYEII